MSKQEREVEPGCAMTFLFCLLVAGLIAICSLLDDIRLSLRVMSERDSLESVEEKEEGP